MTIRRQLHVSRAARRRYGLPPAAFASHGRVVELDLASAARWAEAISAARRGGPLPPLSPGELAAAVALHEAAHALIRGFDAPLRTELDGEIALLRSELGATGLGGFVSAFERAYGAAGGAPGVSEAASAAPLRDLLEEAWLLADALANPAFAVLRELFEDPLNGTPAWLRVVSGAERALSRVPLPHHALGAAAEALEGAPGVPLPAREGTLLWLLTLPRRLAPGSLAGQLRVALEAWGPYLGALSGVLERLLKAADLLREEGKGGSPAPGPPAPPEHPPVSPEAYGAARFSHERAWMTEVAMVAKSTYVWLAQLERAYGTEVRRLDRVPDAALRRLRDDGFNALWLIGVWERSAASRTLKRLRGQPDAGASAYSLHDYTVASALGGEEALRDLARRAAGLGIRLASDMVPNHTGLDSRWMVEHPERFLQLPEPPFPGYSFTGPDLAEDPAIEVRVEDGYYEGTDAAVVFERRDPRSGEKRYVYHGNDGTAMPWNDTAQLDYLRRDVREAVIECIEEVAGRFPIIRFDAAMTLAKRHVQRLWHPRPGEGGAIPSRTRFAVPPAEFERLMPREFWREVVERLARTAPDTLLLAEAFWLLEGFFVRELGMHRVYNSAFMHMLLREENAGYRRLLKALLAFDPRVLQRYVNFMSNPDEESARSQFGAGDKYFAVATLLATLPGLPMFGHGQVEGLSEKYGMEYLAPKLDEVPDPAAETRHRLEIAPLLKARRAFAGAGAFRLFDLVGESGVEEAAYVFTNRPAPVPSATAVLVACNVSPRPVAGVVRASSPFADHLLGGDLRTESVVEALGAREGGPPLLLFAPFVGAAARFEARLDEVRHDGLRLELGPYEAKVLLVSQVGDGVGAVVEARTPRTGADRALMRSLRMDARLTGRRGVAQRRAARRVRR